MIVLAVVGVGTLVFGGCLAALVVGYGRLNVDRGTTPGDSESILPKAITKLGGEDTETSADRERAESHFARNRADHQLRNVRWSSKPLYLAIMTSKDFSGLTSTEAVSEQDAAEYLRERNAERGDLPPLEIYKMERIGTVFTVEYEGFLFGSEKSATETIEVKYDGYELMTRPNEEGETEFSFDRGQSRSVQSVGTVMRQL
jgi:hypothetical protein